MKTFWKLEMHITSDMLEAPAELVVPQQIRASYTTDLVGINAS